MPEYTHTLIPATLEFVPQPQQVQEFLASLIQLGAAPLEPEIRLAKPTGEIGSFVNPFTRTTESRAIYKSQKLPSVEKLARGLKDLSDYEVRLSGKGPPRLPPFAFDFDGSYDFDLQCCLRDETVSMSDWHDEVPIDHTVEFFGRPCSSQDRLGIFLNPHTMEVIEVPGAGCARFWIEFEYGKMLFPAIDDRLDLIEPKVLHCAERDFGVRFLQGCRWCA